MTLIQNNKCIVENIKLKFDLYRIKLIFENHIYHIQ
jgi:hypothetical protein